MADEINFLPSRDPQPAGPGTPHADLLIAARKNSQRDNEAWGAMYRVMEDDQAFLAGRQWDTQDVIDRNTAGHVTLTINDLPQYLDQVVGDMRMNPTQVRVRAADWGAASTKFVSNSGRKYESADVRAGLIRQIEYKSNASLHYNLAGQAAAETGLGWLRLYTEYADENTFAQDICIERIKNRWSVLIDCMAQEPDYSDADHCFVGSWMELDEFNKKFPGEAPTPIGANYQGWWSREGYVRVAEYYWREEYKEGLIQLDNGTLVRESDKAMWDMAMDLPERIVQSREVTRKRVKWCKMTYSRVIGKIRTLPGSRLPVFPVIGKRFEGQEDDFFFGLVRFAKEPKRMENYWLSSATERISLMPTAPWLVTAANVKGYTDTWAGANSGTAAYLPFNIDPDNPGFVPQRQTPPSIPAGEMQMMLAFGEKVKSTVGFHDAGVGKARNEQSGVAIEKLQRESDVGAFVFNDNLRISISGLGQVLNSWLPSIYDSERFITVRHENGEVDTIEINKVDDTGQIINDMTEGMFDIHVETGPAYTTVRAQAADMTMDLVKVLAQIGEGDKAAAIVDIAVAEMDIPGNERIAARLRKMVPPALLDPTELTEEERNAPPPQPTPDQIAANAMAEAKMAQAEADKATALAKADTADATRARARADIAQAEADMVATLVGSPENAETADMELADAKRMQAGAGAKPAGGGLDEAAIREIVMNSIAELIAATQNTGGPDNGRGTGTDTGVQPGTPAAAPAAGGPIA